MSLGRIILSLAFAGCCIGAFVSRRMTIATEAIAEVRKGEAPQTKQKQPSSPLAMGFVLSQGIVGPFAVGMSLDQLQNVIDPRFLEVVKRVHKKVSYPQVIIHLDDEYQWKESLIVELSVGAQPTIQRIVVNDSRFHTDKGVHVGSTLGDLRHAYEGVAFQTGEEGHWLIAYVEFLCMGFVLESSKRDYVGETAANRIPDDMEIVRILVGPEPSAVTESEIEFGANAPTGGRHVTPVRVLRSGMAGADG